MCAVRAVELKIFIPGNDVDAHQFHTGTKKDDKRVQALRARLSQLEEAVSNAEHLPVGSLSRAVGIMNRANGLRNFELSTRAFDIHRTIRDKLISFTQPFIHACQSDADTEHVQSVYAHIMQDINSQLQGKDLEYVRNLMRNAHGEWQLEHSGRRSRCVPQSLEAWLDTPNTKAPPKSPSSIHPYPRLMSSRSDRPFCLSPRAGHVSLPPVGHTMPGAIKLVRSP